MIATTTGIDACVVLPSVFTSALIGQKDLFVCRSDYLARLQTCWLDPAPVDDEEVVILSSSAEMLKVDVR
jgi:hypothetical protein